MEFWYCECVCILSRRMRPSINIAKSFAIMGATTIVKTISVNNRWAIMQRKTAQRAAIAQVFLTKNRPLRIEEVLGIGCILRCIPQPGCGLLQSQAAVRKNWPDQVKLLRLWAPYTNGPKGSSTTSSTARIAIALLRSPGVHLLSRLRLLKDSLSQSMRSFFSVSASPVPVASRGNRLAPALFFPGPSL